jgi:hypothetical protein
LEPGKQTNPKVLTGVSGEYFVAAQLSWLGYIASITLRNTKGVDILASNDNATKAVGIQVKTNQGNKKSWILNKKAEDYFADNLFYVFVNLGNQRSQPNFHVVPSEIVARYVKGAHVKWLAKPGRKGQPHNDTSMRIFNDPSDTYLARWDLLDL